MTVLIGAASPARSRSRAPPEREPSMKKFNQEKLDVYEVALEWVVLADEIVSGLPKGRGYLTDQLQRAA